MHVHLPKPLHGWRQFAGEVGIIVIGVLIALAFEQVVERWSWKDRARNGREELRGELAVDYDQAAELAVTALCIDRQLAALEERVANSGAKLNAAPNYSEAVYARYTYRAPGREWSDEDWQSLVSEGVTSHFDPKFRQRVDAAYDSVRSIRAITRLTDALAYRLQLLARAVPLDSGSRNHLMEQIEEARGYFGDMRLRSNQTIGEINAAGIAPSPKQVEAFLNASGTVKFCRAHAIPLGPIEPQL